MGMGVPLKRGHCPPQYSRSRAAPWSWPSAHRRSGGRKPIRLLWQGLAPSISCGCHSGKGGARVDRPSTQANVQAFLDRVKDAPTGLVFEGAAGIGKTTLLLEAADAARRRGFRVLSTRPSPAESVLAYTALADLLVDVEQAVLDGLP